MAQRIRWTEAAWEDLDAAAEYIFRDSPRTCQYFYVISDGKTNQAVGMEASWNKFTVVKPGEAHELLPKPVKEQLCPVTQVAAPPFWQQGWPPSPQA